jgi:hypothetical protein
MTTIWSVPLGEHLMLAALMFALMADSSALTYTAPSFSKTSYLLR